MLFKCFVEVVHARNQVRIRVQILLHKRVMEEHQHMSTHGVAIASARTSAIFAWDITRTSVMVCVCAGARRADGGGPSHPLPGAVQGSHHRRDGSEPGDGAQVPRAAARAGSRRQQARRPPVASFSMHVPYLRMSGRRVCESSSPCGLVCRLRNAVADSGYFGYCFHWVFGPRRMRVAITHDGGLRGKWGSTTKLSIREPAFS